MMKHWNDWVCARAFRCSILRLFKDLPFKSLCVTRAIWWLIYGELPWYHYITAFLLYHCLPMRSCVCLLILHKHIYWKGVSCTRNVMFSRPFILHDSLRLVLEVLFFSNPAGMWCHLLLIMDPWKYVSQSSNLHFRQLTYKDDSNDNLYLSPEGSPALLQISALRVALKTVPEETKDNVEKKQARTYEEIQAEQAEQELVRMTIIKSCAIHEYSK